MAALPTGIIVGVIRVEHCRRRWAAVDMTVLGVDLGAVVVFAWFSVSLCVTDISVDFVVCVVGDSPFAAWFGFLSPLRLPPSESFWWLLLLSNGIRYLLLRIGCRFW